MNESRSTNKATGVPSVSDINWISPKRPRRNGGAPSNAAFRVTTRGAGKDRRKQASITVYEVAMRELRWVAGDRIAVGVTAGGDIALKRVPAGGYCLSLTGNYTPDERRKALGSTVTCNIKLTADIAKSDRFWLVGEPVYELDGTVVLIQGEQQ